MLVATAVVEGQPTVAGSDLREVLQRRTRANRSGPEAESVSKRSQRVCPYNHVERIRELEQTLEEGLDYLRVREQELVIVTERLEKAEARVAELEPVKYGDARELKGED
jgi:hypothetical protein